MLGAYLVWYFYLVVRLKKLSKSMAAQGCAIKPIKERFSNHKLVGSLLTVLAVVIACGFLFYSLANQELLSWCGSKARLSVPQKRTPSSQRK